MNLCAAEKKDEKWIIHHTMAWNLSLVSHLFHLVLSIIFTFSSNDLISFPASDQAFITTLFVRFAHWNKRLVSDFFTFNHETDDKKQINWFLKSSEKKDERKYEISLKRSSK